MLYGLGRDVNGDRVRVPEEEAGTEKLQPGRAASARPSREIDSGTTMSSWTRGGSPMQLPHLQIPLSYPQCLRLQEAAKGCHLPMTWKNRSQ